MASSPKYQYADWRELHGAKKEAMEELVSGAADVLKGAAKEYAAPFANTAGMLLSEAAKAGQGTAVSEKSDSGKYRGVNAQALHDTQIQAANDYGQAMQNTADRWKQTGTENIGRVKQEVVPMMHIPVDVGVQGLKMLGDAALGTATGIGATPYLALRSFGDAAQTARQEGASVGKQFAYGVGSAISGVAIEKAFDGLSGLYGKSATKKWAEKFGSLFKSDKDFQRYAEAAFNDVGEGIAESYLTDVANQILRSTYNGKGVVENFNETEFDRVKRNMIINTIIGILSGDKVWAER